MEIIVTLLIIGVILLLYQASLNNLFLSRDAEHQEIALRLANNKIEELRAGGYDALPGSGSFFDTQLGLLPGGAATMAVSEFNTNTKKIIITVQWQEPGISASRTLSLTTLITKIGGL